MFRALAMAILALCCFPIFAQAARPEGGQLIIHRAPNFGTIQWLRIWIDGAEVEAVAYGHDFIAPISPGRHVIAVVESSNVWNCPPTKRVFNVRAGGTYQFTAVWRYSRIFLQDFEQGNRRILPDYIP